MSHLERLACAADIKLSVLCDRALVNPKDAELADIRVDDYLEHVREHMLFRIRFGAEFIDSLAIDQLALEEQRRVAFGSVWQQAIKSIEQLVYDRPVA